jgi:penicillin amidase
MHLRITTPGIWHIVHLHGGRYHASGVGLPGVPGIQVGHNARIAWGCTLAFTDNQDLFVERLDPDDPTRYEYQGAWQACESRTETIEVKGRPAPHVETVRQTRHGPLLGGLVQGGGEGLALNSYALRPSQVLAGFAALNLAEGWDDFVEAMRLIQAPPLNVVYADVEGNIGHWVAGTLPVRAKGQGTVPAPGWTGEHEWVGEVPFEEMPHALNPTCGYLVSCNHCLMPAGQNGQAPYPHFLGLHWMNGYRAQRVTAEIERMKVLSREACQALQLDLRSLPGLALVERLRRWQIAPSEPDAALGLKLLLDWDGWLGADSVGGCVYQVTMRRLLERLVAPALGERLFARFLGGNGPHALLAPNSEFAGHASVTLLALLDDAESAWVTEAGGRALVLEQCLAEAVGWLRDTLGVDPAGWQWGRLHTFTAQHALAVRKPLEQVLSLGPYPMGGDTDTVCQTAFAPEAPYQAQAAAPSYRQIVDLGDLERSVHIAPPGNSGVLGDQHYDDLLLPWLKGEYVPAPWSREAVEREAVERLRLEPAGP